MDRDFNFIMDGNRAYKGTTDENLFERHSIYNKLLEKFNRNGLALEGVYGSNF